eukprot:COSAG01_NODE_2517_length_7524_cov_19.201616_6_plen_334_part_00
MMHRTLYLVLLSLTMAPRDRAAAQHPGGGCLSALRAAGCRAGAGTPCRVCAGWRQHSLRAARCSATEVAALCGSGGGQGQDELMPGAVLQASLQAAADRGDASFTLMPGGYNFSSSRLQLSGAADMEIVGVGATLWFSPGGGLMLHGCSGVYIRGLTIDYAPTLAQGVVTSIDSAGSSFTASFDRRFLAPCPNAVAAACKVAFWDPASSTMVRDPGARGAVNIYTDRVQPLPGGALPASNQSSDQRDGEAWDGTGSGDYRLFVRGSRGVHGVALARTGQLVTVFHGAWPHAYACINCTRMTLEGVSIFGGTGMGLVDNQGGGGSTYRVSPLDA